MIRRVMLASLLAAGCLDGAQAGSPSSCAGLPAVTGRDLVVMTPPLQPNVGSVLELGDIDYPRVHEAQGFTIVSAVGVAAEGHVEQGPHVQVMLDAPVQTCPDRALSFQQVYFELVDLDALPPGVRTEPFNFHGDDANSGAVRSPIEQARFTLHRAFLVARVRSDAATVHVTLTNTGDRPTVALNEMHPGTLPPRLLAKNACKGLALKPGQSCDLTFRRARDDTDGDLYLESGGESPINVHIRLGGGEPAATVTYAPER